MLFEGPDGWLYVTRGTIEASKKEILQDKFTDKDTRLPVSSDHMGNFFAAVRTRKDPICPVEGGHQSATVGHLIVIALRTGKTLRWDPSKEKFVGEGAKDANQHLARQMRKPYDYSFA